MNRVSWQVTQWCAFVQIRLAMIENEEEFKEYIKKNDILLEVRVSDFLYEYGESSKIRAPISFLSCDDLKDHIFLEVFIHLNLFSCNMELLRMLHHFYIAHVIE